MAIPAKDGNDSEESGAYGGARPRRNQFLNIQIHHTQTMQETQAEGTHLFVDFLRQQTHAEGLETFNPSDYEREVEAQAESVDLRDLSQATASDSEQPAWTLAGNSLKRLADEFAASKGRQEVRNQAEKVDLSSITFESFQDFLTVLFEDGRNPAERIVTLFFFCSDLVIKSIKRKVGDLTNKLFLWSIKFIIDKVCKWVCEQGGWNSILGSFYQHVLKIGATVVTISIAVAIGLFIWKDHLSK